MSFMIENRSSNEINNKDREHFLTLEMKEDYSFKYIPESHFKHIIRNVQRHRRKEDEERIWVSFVKEQELNNLKFDKKNVDCCMQSMKDLLHENIQDVDRELKRLEEDALPERSKGLQNHKSAVLKNEAIYTKVNGIRNDCSKEKVLTKDTDTLGTNVLASISKANNIPIYKESKTQSTVFRSRAKKSLSDTSIAEKKCYTNQLLRATDFCDNNSDTDSSNNNRNEVVYIQPDPLTIQKLLSMQKKIAELLDEILFRLCRIPLPDGDNDLKRRQRQTKEFAKIFSRNHLYNLNRLVTNIQRRVTAVSSKTGLKQYRKNVAFHQDVIKQKLIDAHQLLIQALSAYYKHIPNSILDGHSTKLQDALQIVCSLTDICDKVEFSTNYFCSGDTTMVPLGKNLQDKCDAILSQLKLNLENKHGPMNCRNVEPTVSIAPISSRKKGCNQKNLSSRLSMYSMDVKVSKNNQKRRNNLRRKSYTCQKESGNNVKGIKNLHAQHCSLPELLYPSPMTHTSSSRDAVQIDVPKSMSYSKEGDIRTVMDELTIDSENDSNVEIQTSRKTAPSIEEQPATVRQKTSAEVWRSKSTESKGVNTKVENITNQVEDDLIKKVTTITKEHLATLAPVINDLVALISKKQNKCEVQPVSDTSMETLREFVQKYQSPKDFDTKDKRCELKKCGENIQLVCVSSADKVSKMTQCDASCQADCLVALKGNQDRKDGMQLTISKEIQLQFLSYRREYKELCKSRPMYCSNTQNKPWDIVAWISDKLIEELLIEITEDFQMKDIIKNMYKMEFQEF